MQTWTCLTHKHETKKQALESEKMHNFSLLSCGELFSYFFSIRCQLCCRFSLHHWKRKASFTSMTTWSGICFNNCIVAAYVTNSSWHKPNLTEDATRLFKVNFDGLQTFKLRAKYFDFPWRENANFRVKRWLLLTVNNLKILFYFCK
jgi:hypothetical protein